MTNNLRSIAAQITVVLLDEDRDITFSRKMPVTDLPNGVMSMGIIKYLGDYYVFDRVDFVMESIIYTQAAVKELIP